MGCYDDVRLRCPECKADYWAQSKGGECLMREFKLEDCPDDVLSDVNRHAPFQCTECGIFFRVLVTLVRYEIKED